MLSDTPDSTVLPRKAAQIPCSSDSCQTCPFSVLKRLILACLGFTSTRSHSAERTPPARRRCHSAGKDTQNSQKARQPATRISAQFYLAIFSEFQSREHLLSCSPSAVNCPDPGGVSNSCQTLSSMVSESSSKRGVWSKCPGGHTSGSETPTSPCPRSFPERAGTGVEGSSTHSPRQATGPHHDLFPTRFS